MTSPKTAVVTGAASGIGAATVRRLRTRGLRVVLVDRDVARAEALANSIAEQDGPELRVLGCDVTQPDDVDAAARNLDGELDVLVNCAGVAGASARLEQLSLEEWHRVVDVNLWGVVHWIRATTPIMRERGGGCMLNVASVAAIQGSRGQVPYSGAKAGVVGVTIAAAKELMSWNIRVNAVAPGFIETPMTDEMSEQMRTDWRLGELVLGGRLGQADEVASCIEFLTSDDASFLTGVVLPVDGGFHLGYP